MSVSQAAKERFSCIKPTFSRWNNGWLISMTHISGWEVVRYPGERPFILSTEEWNMLPEYRPYGNRTRLPVKQLDDGRWAGYMVVGADRTVVAVGDTAEIAWAKAKGSQFLFPWQMVEAGYECVPIRIEKSGPAVAPKRDRRRDQYTDQPNVQKPLR